MIIEFTMGDQLEKTYKFINPIEKFTSLYLSV